jgi:molybdate transport system substrate-binding protein
VHRAPTALLAVALGFLGPASWSAEAPLRVRASVEAAPCVAAAAAAYGHAVAVETGALREPGAVDVLVGSGVEVTRALEGGDAVVGSEEQVARIPWVLSVPPGNPQGIAGLADLARPGLEVAVLDGPASYEARRALAGHPAVRARQSRDGGALRRAPVALVPLSLAGSGTRIAVDVPAIPIGAAVAAHAARPAEARAFVTFLASEKGQAAFAACGRD